MSIYVDEFEKMYGVSQNLKWLKNKILELAMGGKLVAQDFNDVGAIQLLENIELKRKELNAKQFKKDKVFLASLPKNWESVRIGQLFELTNGLAFKPTDWSSEGLPIIRIQNLNNPNGKYNYCNFEVAQKYYVSNGDILIGWSGTPGTSFGAFIWDRGNAVLNQHIFNAKPYVELNREFLRLGINSKLNEMISKAHGGAGLQHITKKNFEQISIPLPSIDEQNRIVESYAQVISLIEKLEEQLKKKEHLLKQLPQAIVDSIGACKTGEELKEQLEFVIQNFETIFQTPESMQELRNVILQLAIEGKLVQQDPTDEPASELLKRIEAECEQLVKEKKIKKPSKLEPISEDEIPFEVPESWELIRVGSVIELISGRDESVNDCNEESIGIPYVMGASNIYKNQFTPIRWIKEPKVVSSIGDLVITVKGTVGKYFINDKCDINLSRQAMALRPIDGDMLSYITLWFRGYIVELNLKSQGLIPGVSRDDILNSIMPLPPKKEQYRIVEKVNSLMEIIDQMEEKLKKKVEIVEKLGMA